MRDCTMFDKIPNLTIKHQAIEESENPVWNLTPFVYLGGAQIIRSGNWISKIQALPLISERIKVMQSIKEYVIRTLDSGTSDKTAITQLFRLKEFIQFADKYDKTLSCPKEIEKLLYDYAEHAYIRHAHRKIKMVTAYSQTIGIKTIFTGAFENIKFNIRHTRLKKTVRSQRAISREADKVMLGNASILGGFCFDIVTNFKPKNLNQGVLPISVKVRSALSKNPINLTPGRKNTFTNKDFLYKSAESAFNNRVSAESMIFLAMTIQNISPTYNLRLEKFSFKPIGEKYEVREFKERKGGEVLFKIPKPYRIHFERYMEFIRKYAPKSEWLFPFLKKGVGYVKRNDASINSFKKLCIKYGIPWTPPREFRKIGENILMRLCSDEQTTADYANHGVATFKQYYEFPSLQKAIIEVTRFWNKNDPLTYGAPKVSLFNTLCVGTSKEIKKITDKLPRPDCITPTGCIGCENYRDENSFDYVWNLHSFKYLKIIESSLYRTKEEKPSNIAIDWSNIKINWFAQSQEPKHKEWIKEAKARIEEGYYHSTWSKKIEKYEG